MLEMNQSNIVPHMQVKDWVSLFLSLGTKCEGHHKKNVTPYMHALVCHVPEQINKYGNIKMFSGQGELPL